MPMPTTINTMGGISVNQSTGLVSNNGTSSVNNIPLGIMLCPYLACASCPASVSLLVLGNVVSMPHSGQNRESLAILAPQYRHPCKGSPQCLQNLAMGVTPPHLGQVIVSVISGHKIQSKGWDVNINHQEKTANWKMQTFLPLREGLEGGVKFLYVKIL